MEESDFITLLIKAIEPYDPLDLLAKIGALQLCPENANHAIRFEALAHTVNCTDYQPNKPVCSRHRLNRICNEPPLGRSLIESQEDPSPNAFTEAFTFFGGSYIVFPGQLTDPTFILKHLNAAIFFSNRFGDNRKFINDIYSLNQGVLALSDLIASRAGLVRNMAPNPLDRKIFIPPDIEAKKCLVMYSIQEMDNYLGSTGLSASCLEPFIQPFGQLNGGSYSFQSSPLHAQPIIRFEDRLIIAEPLMLLAALRHRILTTAKQYGVMDLLFEEYQKANLMTVGASLDRLGHRQIPFPLPETENDLSIQESIWSLDTDKMLYAVVMSDNFTDYNGDEVFEDKSWIEEGDLLDKHLLIAEQHIRQVASNLGDIFFLIVHAGVGRSRIIGLQLIGLTKEPIVLMLSPPELEILSLLYFHEPLVLYKYAIANQAIRESAKVISWSTLDEFEVYRKHRCSYYMDDGERPVLISIGVGGERELRLEVLQKQDIHAVPYLDSRGWVEVMNVHQTPSCPIYAPVQNHPKQVGFFVELSPVSFWVVAQINGSRSESNLRMLNPGIFVDLISYWLWQFAEELSLCLSEVNFDSPLIIDVRMDESAQWSWESSIDETNPYSLDICSEYTIQVTLYPPILSLLNTANNICEIEIMRRIFEEGLCALLEADGWTEPSSRLKTLIPKWVKKQIDLPNKKKLIALNPNITPALLPGNPISFRKVQEADISKLIDEIGGFLKNDFHLNKGIIPNDQHSQVLNAIVAYCFNKLSLIVDNLCKEHLLDFLVTYNEAIVSERFYRQITIATQLACFSSSEELTEQLVKQLPEIDDAALASRFLIELVVAKSPIGNDPISLTIYDEMMALASEIIGRGSQSDFAKYKLFDFRFELLGSGRLGMNREEFNSKVNAYQNSRSKTEIFEAIDSFPRWWREKVIADSNDYPPHIKELNRAFQAEFGLILTDISNFISELGDLSMEIVNGQMKTMELESLVERMTSILEWSSDKLHSVINFLALAPRKDFLSPPPPFQKTDVYPWRMSRGLSYMRRPLLITKNGDQTIVCWGVRHLFASFDYLLHSTISGRLQDNYHSKEMRKFLGKVHVDEGEQFNDRVLSAIYPLSGVIAAKKVKKFGSTRIGAPGNDLGDLDVLAIFPASKTIIIIECKELEIARNPIEMSRELETLFIGDGHNEATMTKHLRRVEWVKNNLPLVLNSYGINNDRRWKIDPLLVVSSEMISPHFYTAPMPVYSFNRFKSEYLKRYS
jgi:hypothetical protein